jgi:putative Mg2+ transporter-C (MgtC) family protein
LTTAAAVWLTAGLGIACGLGAFPLALAGLAVALVTLIIGRPIELYLEKLLPVKHGKRSGSADDPNDLDG